MIGDEHVSAVEIQQIREQVRIVSDGHIRSEERIATIQKDLSEIAGDLKAFIRQSRENEKSNQKTINHLFTMNQSSERRVADISELFGELSAETGEIKDELIAMRTKSKLVYSAIGFISVSLATSIIALFFSWIPTP